MTLQGYGNLITGTTPASLIPHPDNDGSFLIQTLDGFNLSVDSKGVLNKTHNAQGDEKWWKGTKCMSNINTFSGVKYFFLEWFE